MNRPAECSRIAPHLDPSRLILAGAIVALTVACGSGSIPPIVQELEAALPDTAEVRTYEEVGPWGEQSS